MTDAKVNLKKKQEEFQKEYCYRCFRFDPEKQEFKEKGNRNNVNGCKYHITHVTDPTGQCWNYHERNEIGIDLGWVKEEEERRKKNPIIQLPDNQKRVQQLKLKLLEYKQRRDLYRHRPLGLQMGEICKIEALSWLLEKHTLEIWGLMAEMQEKYDANFNKGDFFHACNIIEDYCLTGGANRRGKGTGLRPM